MIMKLRLRSIETKQTLRLEVPNPCSLHRLKQTLADSISAATPSSLRLSLNHRDELLPSSPVADDSLSSLGITSGDLIFYSLDPQTLQPPIPQTLIPLISQTLIAEARPETLIEPIAEEHRSMDSDSQTQIEEKPGTSMESETLVGEAMEVDEEEPNGGVRRKYSVPFFLRRVMREELAEDRSDHKLLVIALHAVLWESGFVSFDSVSGSQTGLCRLPEEWPAVAYTLSLSYTLPEILANRGNAGGGIEAVVLKIQTLGPFVNVYGCLAGGGGGFGASRVSLDVKRFAPMLDFVWESRNVSDSEVFVPEVEIFEFWRIVKDGIAYALLIDLCAKAGLPEPPSFMCLPLDLKKNILESLSGVELAKVGCACKELQNLVSKDELWKQKFVEEFGPEARGVGNWKFRYAGKWEEREQQKKAVVRWTDSRPGHIFPMTREPNPRLPYPLGGGGQPVIFQHWRGRNFSPNCNLGGRRV